MLQLNCPWCGNRDEIEFSCGGEAHISRPLYNKKISDREKELKISFEDFEEVHNMNKGDL